ncbi:uncharacterized protein LOC132547832 [Ylistrum balloti]|uniref:uncharacterized protein LOC132547832 n=1 Tax=Ylistrum balloti TaxID=509963 RepID=UPI002905ECBF|nr:uncharacterized protein LOC132547832 [Ylistrum balloti]
MSRSGNVEVVVDVSRCLDVVRKLEKCDVIAVDAEGVQLGKDGPLTLLQVGTIDHDVFLFDIHVNKDLFTKGRLQDILTSNRIIKVMHSCSGDSAALYYQFNIRLHNVFDTQVANLVIEERKGRELVPLMKLDDLCQKYSSVAKVADEKDAVKNTWVREIGDLWAKRPLSDEMIHYAAGDVTAIVPDVYNTMKRSIEEAGLLDQFNKRVEEEILYTFDEMMKEQRRTRVKEAKDRVLRTVDKSYPSDIAFKDIEDEDVKMAIARAHMNDVEKLSPFINRLKRENIAQNLDELEDSFVSEGGIFDIVNGRFSSSLKTAYSCKEPAIQDRTKKLQARVIQITLDNITKKYDVTSPVTYLSSHEKDILNWMRPNPSGERDPRYSKVVLALYWKLMEADLDATIQKLEQETHAFRMNEGHYKKIKFYMHQRTQVPAPIKVKALNFVRRLDKTFGRGVVPRKQ